MSEQQPTQHLRAHDLAERWGLTVKTLSNWRCIGKGPTFVKVHNNVRYRLSDVLAFEDSGTTQAVFA